MVDTCLKHYELPAKTGYDEWFEPDGSTRPACQLIADFLSKMDKDHLWSLHESARAAMIRKGITFTVYGDDEGTERIIPFDLIPRIIAAKEWDHLSAGLIQRTKALNLFLSDIYSDRAIIQDGIIPAALIDRNPAYRPAMIGVQPPKGIWNHISGTDLIRHGDGEVYVLEDNLRCPSGVSYVLENRQLSRRSFPSLFRKLKSNPSITIRGNYSKHSNTLPPVIA